MQLLITGVTGLIGSHLAGAARLQGHRVIAAGLINNSLEEQRQHSLESSGIPVLVGNLQDPQFARKAAAGCDAVIHLAAAQHEAGVPDDYFYGVNVDATRVLLDACVEAGVKRFLYGSTIGVYGQGATAPLDEQSALHPSNIYETTKLAAEAVTKSYATRLETTIIRISETYGPGDGRLLKLFKAADRGLFVLIGPGRNLRQPIHVTDLVRGLLCAVEHPAAIGQTFVLAGPSAITTREMIAEVAAALGRGGTMLRIPMFPFLIAAVICEAACKPLRIQPPLHRRRLDFFRKSLWFSIDKAETLLDFSPTTPFSAGARDTLASYRSAGWVRSRASNRSEQRAV
jgi:nucleoside-diphosphate-sugar epimerase